jgi:hypothetical protein
MKRRKNYEKGIEFSFGCVHGVLLPCAFRVRVGGDLANHYLNNSHRIDHSTDDEAYNEHYNHHNDYYDNNHDPRRRR